MTARWYVPEAERQVNEIRRRLFQLDYELPMVSVVDTELVAQAYMDCEIVRLRGLTDRGALLHLRKEWGLKVDEGEASDQPLAGGLYITADVVRVIFVEAADIPRRQRFSIAHELGHLALEAEAGLEPESLLLVGNASDKAMGGLSVRRYGRCPPGVMEMQEGDVLQDQSDSLVRLSEGQRRARSQHDRNVREWRANFFAAELLMPYAGVKRLIGENVDGLGVRTDSDFERLVKQLAITYDVSPASARLRLSKDLGIIPTERGPNRDLFS